MKCDTCDKEACYDVHACEGCLPGNAAQSSPTQHVVIFIEVTLLCFGGIGA